MSFQSPRSRAWSKITAASSDRIAKRKLQLYRTLSNNNCPVPECETVEVAQGNVFRDREFSSQESEEMRQSNIYDEKAFAEALKDINSELESLRSLYNSQWFADMRRSLEKNKNPNQVANAELYTSTITTEQYPRKTPSNELNVSQYRQNISEMQSTTALIPMTLFQQRQSSLKREVNESNRGQQIFPPHQFRKKVEIPASMATPTNAPIGIVSHTSKEAVNMMNTISEVRKEENRNTTLHTDKQNQFSGADNKHLYNNFTQMLCEVDKITDELTELQRFKDAIYAMNAEFEHKETEASKMSSTLMSHSSFSSSKVPTVVQRHSQKRSPGLSYSSTNINIGLQETNQKVSRFKMPHPGTHYNSEIRKNFHNIQADKKKDWNIELLNSREMREKKKGTGTLNHSLQPTKQKFLVDSFSENKNRYPQADSENALPLEVNPLQVNISAPLVSKKCATNKMSNKNSPKTFKPGSLKRNIK